MQLDAILEVAIGLVFVWLVISVAAAAQGAPFWFDMLRKLVSTRQQTASENKK